MSERPFNIETDAVATNVLAVDMVSTCILFYRRKRRALKAVYLKPRLYEQFRAWVIKNIGEKQFDGRLMQYDSVNIELGSRFQTESLIPEFWPNEINQ